MKLSILIPTLEKRKLQFEQLRSYLKKQILELDAIEDVEILFMRDNGEQTIGEKRNTLLSTAKGKYSCFIDDDDWVCGDYVNLLLKGIEADPDCISLIGIITTNSKNPKRFIHSNIYRDYEVRNGEYVRPPNHLNCIKSSIAKQFEFPEMNFGEDTDWAMQICKAGVLKKEHKVFKPIYFYNYIPK